ncbi:glutathione S-transferase [Muribacter muris]|uniref:Glutathione S-transferase n=1 Tax=Muribacter muris TaxID=67855 RepID=A0A4Y9K1P8_9PAST|nr:glutathione S-transferase [Muribacter muris]MBF0784835.1 glutathione S-transferase [Muribacter muris]MBF0826607.1 glutathione S-transferase [Muribacter muris]TFV11069.1 glutathione S-transferase [Muribacter muris]
MLKLYVNPPKSSWSLRVWILLKQCGIPFEQINVAYLDDKAAQRTQFLTFSPTAKIPVLHYQDQIIWDSLAIVEFIAEHYPHIWAQDWQARAWSRSACAEMHAGFEHLRNICDFRPLDRVELADITPELAAELARLDTLWQQGLTRFGGDYLAGDRFTAVDAFFVPVALRIETYGLQHYFSPASLRYQQRLLGLTTLAEWLAAKR